MEERVDPDSEYPEVRFVERLKDYDLFDDKLMSLLVGLFQTSSRFFSCSEM